MRQYFLTIALFLTLSVSFTQKVDIDNYRIYISCVDLPVNYVPEKARTFTLKLSGDPAFITRDKIDLIKIYGWTKVDNKAGMDVKVNIKGFFAGSPSATQRVDEKKDKDGNVISKNIYHRIRLNNTARGEIRVYGIRDEMTSKGAVKDEKKILKKKSEEASNPFLKNVDTRDDGTSSGDIHSEIPVAYIENLDYTYTYETREYLNKDEAQKEYAANAQIQIRNHENQYRSDYPADVTKFLNRNYGYKPAKYWAKFKRLDTEEHPEFSMFDNATKAIKVIFAKMRYNLPTTQIERDLQPVIDYFQGLTQKYRGSSKHEKNLRGAAYYNLARIYQFLDQHDKVFEIGKAIIATGHDEDEGRDFIKESEEIQRKLDFHQMISRHIKPQNQDQEMDEEGELIP